MKLNEKRVRDLQARMRDARVDLALFGPSADMAYLIGGRLPLTERLNLLAIPQEGRPWLIAPGLQTPLVEPLREAVDLLVWQESEDPLALAAQRISSGEARRIGVNSHLWSSFLLGLQERLPGARFSDASPLALAMRVCKDREEIAILEEAGRRFDAIWSDFFKQGRLAGESELGVAARIRDLVMARGFEGMLWCDVGSGPNGASPLHHGSGRRIKAGEPVVIDFAATLDGYVMDTCRTPVAGEPEAEFVKIHDIVNRAYDAGLAAVAPGRPAQEADRAARAVIAQAGYGSNFLHRLGHGLGLDAHEEPYLVEGAKAPLRTGMVFSIEPGIYLAGRFGVRIENIVAVDEAGGRALNATTREVVSMS